MIGCSGGADSSALVLTLASASRGLVVGHVLHDLRPREQAEADCRAAQELAARMGLPFVRAEVAVRAGRGNMEARARGARYAALDRMAREAGCPYVAVGHHRDDQAETLVMALLRGAGAHGLAGVAESRALAHSTLVRPMLGVSREDCRRVCQEAGWAWREDLTNADSSLLRAAVRHRLLPEAERLRPGAAGRMARTSGLLRDAAMLVQERAEGVWAGGSVRLGAHRGEWDREQLSKERPVVVGELLRTAARRLGNGRGLDRLGSRGLETVVRAIADAERRPREFVVGGVRVTVRARVVELEGSGARG